MLSVSDDGPGIAALDDGIHGQGDFEFSGLGVQNIIDRVDNVYGDKANVLLENKKNFGVNMVIKLPIRNYK